MMVKSKNIIKQVKEGDTEKKTGILTKMEIAIKKIGNLARS